MENSTPEIEVTCLTISPSQLTDYLSCPRKWWFRFIIGLPEEKVVKKWDFGNRLHEVCERWVGASDQGRDSSGKPVDLYPEGWHKDSITKAERQLIQVTVKQACEGKEQVLRRMPERQVELAYKREIIDHVKMSGKLDVHHRDGFEDHKTSGSRKWLSSQNALAKDDKMLCYAHETVMRWWEEEGQIDPDRSINMRFNYFSKDPADVFVKKVDVDVRAEDVMAWWFDTVVPAAEDMLRMKKELLPSEKWAKIEGPRTNKSCQEYGGCKYARICTRVQTPERYTKQIKRINESRSSTTPTPTKKQTMTSIFDKTKPRKNGTVKKDAAKKATPSKKQRDTGRGSKQKPEVEAETETEEVEEVAIVKAPWARPGCKACGGTGVNAKNEPCGACDKINGATGKTTSADFEIVYTDEGTLVFAGEEGEGEIPVLEVEEIPAKVTKKVKKAKAKVEETEYEEAEEAEPEEEKQPVAKKKAKKAKAKKKKAAKKEEESGESTLDHVPEFDLKIEEAKKASSESLEEIEEARSLSFTKALYINCLPINVLSTDLSTIMAREGVELATDMKKDSYFDMAAYERRSYLAACAEEVASELTGAFTVTTGDADVDAYLSAIRPFFDMVVIGTK